MSDPFLAQNPPQSVPFFMHFSSDSKVVDFFEQLGSTSCLKAIPESYAGEGVVQGFIHKPHPTGTVFWNGLRLVAMTGAVLTLLKLATGRGLVEHLLQAKVDGHYCGELTDLFARSLRERTAFSMAGRELLLSASSASLLALSYLIKGYRRMTLSFIACNREPEWVLSHNNAFFNLIVELGSARIHPKKEKVTEYRNNDSSHDGSSCYQNLSLQELRVGYGEPNFLVSPIYQDRSSHVVIDQIDEDYDYGRLPPRRSSIIGRRSRTGRRSSIDSAKGKNSELSGRRFSLGAPTQQNSLNVSFAPNSVGLIGRRHSMHSTMRSTVYTTTGKDQSRRMSLVDSGTNATPKTREILDESAKKTAGFLRTPFSNGSSSSIGRFTPYNKDTPSLPGKSSGPPFKVFSATETGKQLHFSPPKNESPKNEEAGNSDEEDKSLTPTHDGKFQREIIAQMVVRKDRNKDRNLAKSDGKISTPKSMRRDSDLDSHDGNEKLDSPGDLVDELKSERFDLSSEKKPKGELQGARAFSPKGESYTSSSKELQSQTVNALLDFAISPDSRCSTRTWEIGRGSSGSASQTVVNFRNSIGGGRRSSVESDLTTTSPLVGEIIVRDLTSNSLRRKGNLSFTSPKGRGMMQSNANNAPSSEVKDKPKSPLDRFYRKSPQLRERLQKLIEKIVQSQAESRESGHLVSKRCIEDSSVVNKLNPGSESVDALSKVDSSSDPTEKVPMHQPFPENLLKEIRSVKSPSSDRKYSPLPVDETTEKARLTVEALDIFDSILHTPDKIDSAVSSGRSSSDLEDPYFIKDVPTAKNSRVPSPSHNGEKDGVNPNFFLTYEQHSSPTTERTKKHEGGCEVNHVPFAPQKVKPRESRLKVIDEEDPVVKGVSGPETATKVDSAAILEDSTKVLEEIRNSRNAGSFGISKPSVRAKKKPFHNRGAKKESSSRGQKRYEELAKKRLDSIEKSRRRNSNEASTGDGQTGPKKRNYSSAGSYMSPFTSSTLYEPEGKKRNSDIGGGTGLVTAAVQFSTLQSEYQKLSALFLTPGTVLSTRDATSLTKLHTCCEKLQDRLFSLADGDEVKDALDNMREALRIRIWEHENGRIYPWSHREH